jgi:ribonuclease-3
MSEERPRWQDVEEALGHTFTDRELLRVALTHRSYSNERDEDENYERLEFLGDSVLGLVAARWLYHRFPERSEGELAKLKGFLVSARSLAAYARAIDLGPEILLGVGEDRSGGRAKSSILCDVVESLIGGVYLDAGFDAARGVVEPLLEHALEERSRRPHADFKTTLQERTQARGWGLPKYRVAEETGPDHQKEFTVECSVDGHKLATARGRSKKQAAQAAAAGALEKLERL